MSNPKPKPVTGQKLKPVHQRKSGKRERREMVSAAEVGAHCDAFFEKRGITSTTQFPWSKFGKNKP